MSDQPRLEEKAIENLIKTALTSQFDYVKRIAVDIQTNLLKLIQGQVDSIEVSGQDIVTEDIHIKEIEIQTDEISIDPLNIFLGKIRLNEPIDTNIHLVLTEANLNHNLNSDLVLENLKPLQINVDGEIVSVELRPPFSIRLPRNNQIRFTGIMKLSQGEQSRETAFTSLISPRTETQPIRLETFCCPPGQGASLSFITALIQKLEALSKQPYFQIGETTLRLASLVVEAKKLTVEIEAQAQQISTLG